MVGSHGHPEATPGPYETPGQALAFLARLASQFTAVLNLKELVDRVLESLREELGFDSCSIALLDDADPDVLTIVGAAGIRSGYRRLRIPRGLGLTWAVMDAATPLYVPDMDADSRVYRRDPNVKSGIYAPLTLRGHSSGVLSAHRSAVDAFSVQERHLLTVVARYLAGAFEVARLYGEAERLATVLESSEEAIIGVTLDGAIQTWNAGAARIFGFSAPEAIGRPGTIIVPPDHLGEHSRNWERLRRGEHINYFETIRMRKDGSHITVALTLSPLRDAAGQLTGVLAIGQDITQRKRNEDALRRSDERYRTLFDGVPVGLCRITPGGEILKANAAFVKMLKYPNRAMLFQANAEALCADAGMWRDWAARVVSEREVANVEGRLRSHDGSLITVRLSGRAVFDTSDRVSYFEHAVEDITHSKVVEEEARRTREAERANQAKSEFLSRVSHELRTPLNAILGFAQLIEMDAANLTSDHRESLEHILRAGHHLLNLIDEVLDITRIESGRIRILLEPVALQEIMDEALDLTSPMALRAGIHLESDPLCPLDRHVLVDRQRIKHVLLNLLSNAVKYNRAGQSVVLSCAEIPNNMLRLSVRDTGLGIPPEKMAELFVPFERLGAEESGIEGTGLGLAVSKRLIDAMGGTLGVQSIVGEGSTFWVDLALATDGGENACRKTLPPDVPDFAGLTRRLVILYIEDNLSNLELVKRVLARYPEVTLIPAMHGRLGFDLAREHRPHLILLDVHLPDIDGEELLRQLKDAPETRAIPVVALSADATRAQIERMRSAGARGYLTKPLNVRDFLNEILRDTALLQAGAP
jgi:PAS domain S-box-containing protein